jgi:signal transduction histidine kinase
VLATAIENAESREALERLADEQAALRRVATLVARGVPSAEIFSAVSNEVGRLFGTDSAAVVRFEHDPPAIVFVGVAKRSIEVLPVGTRWELDDAMASAEVYRTGRSARVNARDWAAVSAPVAAAGRRLGVVSSVASPIIVEGRRWGAMTVSAREVLPVDTEERLEKFTELIATAIANAESRSELAESRRRIVAASDEARRRIERDLHDGTQQRLVSLSLALRAAEADVPPGSGSLQSELSAVVAGLTEALEDLQELSRGIHPAILSQGGLAPALRTLARRSTIRVDLNLDVGRGSRLPEPVEVAAYFVASEALANATKHAQASRIELSLVPFDGSLLLSIRDDGVGGADAARGSGLVGLTDRVEALGGRIDVESAPGGGTSLVATLPLDVEPTRGPPRATE